MDALIFIDTNILLDFYRIRGGDIGLSLLSHIDDNHHKIITGNQVEMEFKKNRQKVILESINRIKIPDWSCLTPPSYLSEAQPTKVIEKNKKELVKQQKALKKRLVSILKNPAQNDPVYQCMQRLFKNGGEYNLDRNKKIRKKIRSLAWKRFILGYPPRKKEDTSMGDAVNWEWVIQCAKDSGNHIIIVSRDSDYGITNDNQSILNDALQQEFRERISAKRKLKLTDRLTEAFKLASIPVTKKEVEQERELIEAISDERDVKVERDRLALQETVKQIDKIFGKEWIYSANTDKSE